MSNGDKPAIVKTLKDITPRTILYQCDSDYCQNPVKWFVREKSIHSVGVNENGNMILYMYKSESVPIEIINSDQTFIGNCRMNGHGIKQTYFINKWEAEIHIRQKVISHIRELEHNIMRLRKDNSDLLNPSYNLKGFFKPLIS